MKLLRWIFAIAIVTVLAACNGDQSAEDAAEDTKEKTEAVYEDTKESAEEAWDETKEGARDLADASSEAAGDAKESGTWQATKDRADRAWTATKEYSMEAWDKVRESFRGDMTAEDKRTFDECVVRLQKVEGLTKNQAERGCWRMMEEGTRDDYYAEKGDSEFWASVKEGTGDAWDSTKETTRKAWTATKEYSTEAWGKVRESFRGDMTAEDKRTFDECVVRLQKVEGLTKNQAERGCWRMMEEGTRDDYYAERGDSEFWANVKEGAGDAWESTKEGSRKAWEATKEYSQEAWAEVRESFRGDMTAEEKRKFDACVTRLQKEEGLTKDQAGRGCWRMMEESRQSGSGGGGNG